MQSLTYSLTYHNNYNKLYFYKLNRFVLVAKNVELTGASIAKLQRAAEQGLLK